MAKSKNTQVATADAEERDPNAPIVVPVRVSPAFKAALDAYAEANDTTVAGLAREAIAAVIGYDISGEPETHRKSKYETPFDKELGRLVGLARTKARNDSLLAAHKARVAGKTDDAERYDRIVAEAMAGKWMPDDEALEALRKKAQESIDKLAKGE